MVICIDSSIISTTTTTTVTITVTTTPLSTTTTTTIQSVDCGNSCIDGCTKYYLVKSGEYPYAIAAELGISYSTLLMLNNNFNGQYR
jgi:LysM repeat protein